MQKYFKEETNTKISLLDYFNKVDAEYENIEQKKKSLRYVRIRHIYRALGDVLIEEEVIDALCQTFDSYKCRYGTTCLSKETINGLYEISLIFPELTKEALISISREYIKDLFDEYSFINTLCLMIRKDGAVDSTFEKFMDIVKIAADEKEKIYEKEALDIQFYYGQYSYIFIEHFQKFLKQHYITCQEFGEALPDAELILRDILYLKDIARRSRECWSYCQPISFQMLEHYLDGDTELSEFDEIPSYYVSTVDKYFPTSFTKTEFLNSIAKQKKLKK